MKPTIPLAALAVMALIHSTSAAIGIADGNGSFETNGADLTNDFFDNVGLYELDTVGGTIPGWTFDTPGAGTGRWFMQNGCGYGLASDGTAFLNLSNALAGYTATCTISGLDIGQRYILTFEASLRQNVTAGSFSVALDLASPLVVTINAADLPANPGLANYAPQAIPFTATNTSHILTVDSANASGAGVLVDNFAVIPAPFTPAAWWSGETSATWDDTTVNFTGQAFGDFKTAGGIQVIFADNDGNSIPVTRNNVSIAAGGVSINLVRFDNNSLNYTLNSTDANGISGASSLTKSGTGTLTLAGPNTYTGTTIIADGAIILSGGGERLPAGTVLTLGDGLTNTGGILKLNGNSQSVGALRSAGSGTANQVLNGSATAAVFTVNGSTATAFAGTLGGASADEDNFSLVKSGGGLLELTASNSHSGSTAVNGGTLVLANPSAAGSGNLAVTDAAILGVSTTGTIANAIDLAGSPTIRSLLNSSATLSGDITNGSSAGTVLVDFPASPSTLTLTGSSVDLGTKSLVVQGASANGGFYGVNPSLVINGSAVAVGGDTAVGRANLTIQNGSLTTTRLTTPTGAGYSADWGNVNINGGTVTATNGVDGSVGTMATFALFLNGGELRTPSIRVADREYGPGNSAWLTFNGGQVTVTGADNANFITLYGGNQNSYVGSGGAIINTNNFNIGIGVNLKAAGAGGLTKQGAGTLTLSGTNTYSGDTTVEAGSLVLASGGSSRFHPTLNNTSNKITGTGNPPVSLDGEIYLELAAANLTNGNTWLIVDAASIAATYGGSFTVTSSLGSFINDSGVWTMIRANTTWVFSQFTGELVLHVDSSAPTIALGNGSFEANGADLTNDFSDIVGLYELDTVGGTIPGWAFNTPNGTGRWFMQNVCGYGLASDGTAFLNLSNALAGYTASCTLAGLTVGQSYTVTFDVSRRQNVTGGSFTVALDLASPLVVTINAADLPANPGLANYAPQAISFTATNTSHILTLDSTNASGNGFLVDNFALVAGGSDPFTSWIGGFPGLSDSTPGGDPDSDGIPNLLEYVLQNGDPAVSSTAILPSSVTTATDFVFTFYRRAATTADTTQIFQYSDNLTDWNPLAIPGGTGVVVTDIGGGIDEVLVTVPRGSNAALFGRLKVTKP
ncbi:MAG: autotransporter-associated beta strand repeat-containing protein [Verrucomicrobia bacterium]|nr:autotransporter-associated beta strand repeat-containing protein [Verrucomicrobiota bacterium]